MEHARFQYKQRNHDRRMHERRDKNPLTDPVRERRRGAGSVDVSLPVHPLPCVIDLRQARRHGVLPPIRQLQPRELKFESRTLVNQPQPHFSQPAHHAEQFRPLRQDARSARA